MKSQGLLRRLRRTLKDLSALPVEIVWYAP